KRSELDSDRKHGPGDGTKATSRGQERGISRVPASTSCIAPGTHPVRLAATPPSPWDCNTVNASSDEARARSGRSRNWVPSSIRDARSAPWDNATIMEASRTTIAVQRYLDALKAQPAEAGAPQVIRELLERSAMRLHLLCASMIRRSYPRLARPPLNLRSEEMLSAVVERLIKALRESRPASVREFFGLANMHIRWELNDLARRLDEHTPPVEMEEQHIADQAPSETSLTANARRILAALDSLGEEEREVFGLVRMQGLTHDEASEVLGVSTKTVQRRLNRGRVQLATLLRDLEPQDGASGEDVADM